MKKLYEILVPTSMDREGKIYPVRRKYHKVWDAKVRKISGGLSIYPVIYGQWVSEEKTVAERMIPVRICCTEDEIVEICDMTADYYNQDAIMYYVVSNDVRIRNYK